MDRWFTYYYWEDDSKAPDYARTVDIHRKPGYDPVELFIDPGLSLPYLKIACKLIKKKLGFRTLFNMISLDANLVKGSHGRVSKSAQESPVFITDQKDILENSSVKATEVKDIILKHIFK